MGGLATIGAIDTASITLERWGVIGELACPGGADGCDKVLNSAWGTVLGQPLALFGFLAYLALVLLSLLLSPASDGVLAQPRLIPAALRTVQSLNDVHEHADHG